MMGRSIGRPLSEPPRGVQPRAAPDVTESNRHLTLPAAQGRIATGLANGFAHDGGEVVRAVSVDERDRTGPASLAAVRHDGRPVGQRSTGLVEGGETPSAG